MLVLSKNKKTFSASALFFMVLTFWTCSSGQSTERQIKNIKSFARLYGYVKYFYPGDEAAAVDWERFAVYGVRRVEKATDSGQLKQALEELFRPVAPALVIYKSDENRTFSTAAITPPDKNGMKVVTWQHKGVGLAQNSIYKSARLYRYKKPVIPDSFGAAAHFIAAAPYRGKQIKLKAAMKVKQGKGQLWLRVDRPNRQMGFFYNMDDRPYTLPDWKYFEFEGMVAADAVNIFFGCFLSGRGQLWVDDFHLYSREKGSSTWNPVSFQNPGFEEDTEKKAPQHWHAGSKFYSFLVSGETPAAGSKSLEIKSLSKDAVMARGLFEQRAGFGEHIAKELGSGLSCLMPIALYGTDSQTFPKAPETELKQLKEAIKKDLPGELSPTLLYVRLGSLVMTWNIFQHFFPYFDAVKSDWNAALTEALQSAYKDKTAADFQRTLQKFTALLKDGHVRVSRTGDTSKTHFPPISWALVEDRLVITDVYDPDLTAVRPGDIVTEIDGVPAEQVMEEEKQYISAATRGWLQYRLTGILLAGPANSNLKLKIRRRNKVVEAVIQRDKSLKEYYPMRIGKQQFKIIAPGIYYLDLGQLAWDEIEKIMPELETAKAIICDLRGYPKDTRLLISHLLKEKDRSDAWMRIPLVIYPDYEKVTYENLGWRMEPARPHQQAKIVFITDGRAISYAESYMSFIEHYKLATIVGEPTAGTNGNINYFTLPGGYRIVWTGMRVVKHDGSQHHGVGILPDVRVKRTIKGVREGRDEFLEKAVQIARE
jgi:hypothetical protein